MKRLFSDSFNSFLFLDNFSSYFLLHCAKQSSFTQEVEPNAVLIFTKDVNQY